MELFGIGIEKMLVILVLALIIVGPQKTIEMAQKLGRAVGEFKAQTDAFRQMLSLDLPVDGRPTRQAAPPAALYQDERVLSLMAYNRPQDKPAPPVEPVEPVQEAHS
ncbi:MAG: twin-arginine translocase TatA/TatE family subunit [Chloroflexia bacterium]